MSPVLGSRGAAAARGFGLFGGSPQIEYLGAWRNTNVATVDISSGDVFGFSFSGTNALQQNDVLLVATGWVGINGADGNPGVTTSGFTEVADLYSGDTVSSYRSTNLSVSYKVMGATPDSSISISTGGSIYGIAVLGFRNVNPTNPLDATTTTATAVASLNVDGPSITTVTDKAVCVTLGMFGASTSNPGFGPPTTNIVATNFGTFTGSDPNTVYFSITYTAHRVSPAAPYDIAAWSQNSDSLGAWAAATLALRPLT